MARSNDPPWWIQLEILISDEIRNAAQQMGRASYNMEAAKLIAKRIPDRLRAEGWTIYVGNEPR
jgi:hypothetical protein